MCFFVFKSPLTKLADPDDLELVIERAREIEEDIPICALLDRAEQEEEVKVTRRETTPYR